MLLGVAVVAMLAGLAYESVQPVHELLRMVAMGVFGVAGGLLVLFGAARAVWGIWRAMQSHPTLCIAFKDDDEGGQLEFWYRPGTNPRLDALVGQLKKLSRSPAEGFERVGAAVSYTRRHVRPVRALVTGAAAMTCMLILLTTLVLILWEAWAGRDIAVQPALLSLFVLPWLFVLAMYLLDQVRVHFEPAPYRTGLRHYYREEFDKAERRFLDTLREAPQHVPSLYFLAQLTAQRFDFDRAFHFCRDLGRVAPEEAEELQEEIWTLKRIKGRMEG
ncbi:MAG: tetratricopeptide repeat protein [Candidatus Hydrogenedentota bacterium]